MMGGTTVADVTPPCVSTSTSKSTASSPVASGTRIAGQFDLCAASFHLSTRTSSCCPQSTEHSSATRTESLRIRHQYKVFVRREFSPVGRGEVAGVPIFSGVET